MISLEYIRDHVATALVCWSDNVDPHLYVSPVVGSLLGLDVASGEQQSRVRFGRYSVAVHVHLYFKPEAAYLSNGPTKIAVLRAAPEAPKVQERRGFEFL